MLATNRWVFFFERFFVLDRLCLNVIDLRHATLPRVAIQQTGLGTAEPDLGKFFGKIDGVMDAAVHPHTTDWVVDMSAIADKQRTTLVKGVRYTLMYRVECIIGNIIIAVFLMSLADGVEDSQCSTLPHPS